SRPTFDRERSHPVDDSHSRTGHHLQSGRGGKMTTHPRRGRKRFGIRSERGAAVVVVPVAPPLLFLIFFSINYYFCCLHAWDAAETASRDGARVAAVAPNESPIIARVQSAASVLDASKLGVTVACSHNNGVSFGGCGPASTWAEGDIVRVTVTYDYHFMTPLASPLRPGQP